MDCGKSDHSNPALTIRKFPTKVGVRKKWILSSAKDNNIRKIME